MSVYLKGAALAGIGGLALGILSCGSELNVKQESAAEADASRGDSGKYHWSDYTVHFKDGTDYDHYLSGYDIDPMNALNHQGYVVLYNYYNSDVNAINGKLNSLNIEHRTHTTPGGSYAYGWNKFYSSNIYGIGSIHFSTWYYDTVDIWYENPSYTGLDHLFIGKLDNAQFLKPYTNPRCAGREKWFNKSFQNVFNFQKTNARASLMLDFYEKINWNESQFVNLTNSPLEIIYRDGDTILLDASKIVRFALNRLYSY